MAYLYNSFRYPSDGDKKTLPDGQVVSESDEECCQQSQNQGGGNASEDQAQLLHTYLRYLQETQF